MLTNFAVAWRTVIKRLLSDWLVIGAVFVSVLLAAALLAAGPIYADAVTLSALRRSVAEAPALAAGVSVEVAVFPRDYGPVDQLARQELSDALAATGGEVHAHLEADAYGLVDSSETELTELVTLQAFERVEAHASVVEGRWPIHDDRSLEAAISAATAEVMGAGVGDHIDVANRLHPTHTATVEVVGIYLVDDPGDPYWLDGAQIAAGVTESGTFRTFGPLLVSADALLAQLAPARVTATWRALPDLAQLSVAEVVRLRDATGRIGQELELGLPRVLGDRADATSGFTVASDLPDLLTAVDASLTVTRSSVIALLFQLAILAGYALVLAAGLLADTRSTETALVRSRGASPRQLVTTALVESLLIAVPAAVAAPFLATWLLGVLNRVGPLAAIDLTIDPEVNAGAFVLAALASLLSVLVLTSTALASARSFPGRSRAKGRQIAQSVSQRIGLDIALIALALVAFWQLGEIGPEISSRVRGQFGVDPLLVLAPALGLLAGAVLALRVVPLLARVAEWLASRGRGSMAALASWQVSRRPSRYARSALLLIMAIGIGFFASSYATSWRISQRDQAAHATGSDIRVIPWQGSGAIAPMHLRSAYQSLPGVSDSTPVHTTRGQLGRGGELAEFVVVDAEAASNVVDIRQDLSPDWPDLMSHLAAGRPELASIALPGEPTEIGLTLEADELIPQGDDFLSCDFLDEDEEPDPEETCFRAELSVVLRDGAGLLHRVAIAQVPVNSGEETISTSLVDRTDGGEAFEPTYPLELIAIELRSRLPQLASRVVDLSISSIDLQTPTGRQALQVDFEEQGWRVESATFGSLSSGPSIVAQTGSAGRLSVEIETGAGFTGAGSYFGLRPTGSAFPEAIPVVTSHDLVEALGIGIGDTVRLTPLRLEFDSVVVGTFLAFPRTDPSRRAVAIVDLPTYQAASYELGEPLPLPEEHWIATSGRSDGVASRLRTAPFNSFEVESQQELLDQLTADPVALATIGALTVGFVAAAVFSIVGFAVTATVSARERLVEFALIQALGMSRRQLAVWLGMEQGALVLVSLALGTLVGVVLTGVLLPLVILTQAGAPPTPETIVTYPWATVLILELSVVSALGVVVAIMSLSLRRIGLGSLLRIGED